MANELKRSPRDAVHETTTFGFSWSPRASGAIFLLNSDDVHFKDIPGGDDEVWNGADFSARGGPFRLEVLRLNRRNSRHEVGAWVRDEPRCTVLNARRPVHHLVCREAHFRRRLVCENPRVLNSRAREEKDSRSSGGRFRVLERHRVSVLRVGA